MYYISPFIILLFLLLFLSLVFIIPKLYNSFFLMYITFSVLSFYNNLMYLLFEGVCIFLYIYCNCFYYCCVVSCINAKYKFRSCIVRDSKNNNKKTSGYRVTL